MSELVLDRVVPAIRALGRQPYAQTYAAMRAFTAARTDATPDELWIVEHDPVYTAGSAARPAHFPRRDGIPLVRVDRGGQITYHGPGQAVVYTLVDLARRRLAVRAFVCVLEQAVIDVLARFRVHAERRASAPGVYVGGAKIAALGLRVSRGRSYHGVAINCDTELAPYGAIDPCGYPGLAITRTVDHGIALSVEALGCACAERVKALL